MTYDIQHAATCNSPRARRTLMVVAGALIAAQAVALADAPNASDAFAAQCAAMAATAEQSDAFAVAGRDGWSFLAAELRHVGAGRFWGADAALASRAAKPGWADPLPAILDFKAQLDQAGIELLLVPVPPKAIVYPDVLPGTMPAPEASGTAVTRFDSAAREFYGLLKDKGVRVLDLGDTFIAARADDGDGRQVYCRTDTHWSSRACEIAARLIREQVGDADWLPSGANPFQTQETTIDITGDLVKSAGGAGETLRVRLVQPGAGDEAEDRASPVLLLGDSHCLVFHSGGDMLATGAGLADQLAAELGMAVDLLGVRGSGATSARISLMRRVRADADYLGRKKLVIWCFAAREFTQSSGWRLVPVVPKVVAP